MEEIPTFYNELTHKVLRVKYALPHASTEKLIKELYDLYTFCLGAVAQHSEDEAKELMKDRNKRLHERIELMRHNELKQAENCDGRNAGKVEESVEKKWINAMRNMENAPLRENTGEIPISVMGTPLP